VTRARTNADNVTADIAGITAGTGITGGGTSGTVTITNDMATTIAAAGDLIYGTANDAYAALSLGTAGKVLKVNSGATAPEWAVDPTTDVVTTAGDLIYGTGADAVTRLGLGTASQYLRVNSGATAPEWATLSTGGMTLISTTSLSGATVTLSSIPQTYVSLYLVMTGLTNTGGNGGNRIAFNNVTNLTNKTGVFNSSVNQRTLTYLELGEGGSTLRTDTNNIFVVTVDNYTSTTNYKTGKLYGSSLSESSVRNQFQFAHVFLSNTALTSIVISNDGGNLSTGTALLYGVK